MKKTIGCFVAVAAATTFAGNLVQWQDTNLSLLYGTGFEVNPETQETMTLEHASGWSFGDLYAFADLIYYNGDTDFFNGDGSFYGEVSPRLSAGKILKKDLKTFFIKDYLVAGCFEFGENNLNNYLIGAGLDLDIPGFDFFQFNAYRRFDDARYQPESYQITPVWKLSVPLGVSQFIFDGYIDWVFGEVEHLHINPQFKLDVGAWFGMDKGALLGGVEYDFWKDKYGIKGAPTQNAVSGLVQYHF